MRLNVDLQLRDIPGELINALEPLSEVDANIAGVVHHHDWVKGDRIGVNITFDICNQKQLDLLLAKWKQCGVEVVRMGSVFKTYDVEYVLVGPVSPTILENLLDEVKTMTSLASVDIKYTASQDFQRRAAYVSGTVLEESDLDVIDEFFHRRTDEIGLLLIRGGVGR